jgi:hypothetical protein
MATYETLQFQNGGTSTMGAAEYGIGRAVLVKRQVMYGEGDEDERGRMRANPAELDEWIRLALEPLSGFLLFFFVISFLGLFLFWVSFFFGSLSFRTYLSTHWAAGRGFAILESPHDLDKLSKNCSSF